MKEKAAFDKVYTRPKTATMPTMLKFQNGKLAAISKDNTKFVRMQRKKDNSAAAMVLASGQIYHGMIDADAANELTDSYICVRNKTTNKVRVIPIEHVRLNNHIYNTLESPDLGFLEEGNDKTRKLLAKQFGGRKASRFVNNQENMKFDIEVLKDGLENTLNESTFADETSESVNVEQNFDIIRPPCNKNATRLHEVYNVHDVVPAELLERMDEESKVVFATAVDKLPISSEYLLKCIKNIQSATPSAESFLHVKLIIFMDCLTNLIKSRARTMKNIELSGITEKVENHVRDFFSDPNTKPFTRTPHSTEKALCYYIVLALLISENYQVDANILANELCVAKKKIMKFAHVVNAVVKPKSDILTLQLPESMKPMKTKFNRKSKI